MARDPGSKWKPLPEAGAPDGYKKTQFIVHSTGNRGSAAGNWNYFSGGAVVVESTFIIGLTPADPTLQIMDSTDNADANGSANQRGISVEVVGSGDDDFTAWQISELIRIGRWAAATHPIEKRVIPSEPASGFGWHVMFGAPGPWTSAKGKVCPGGKRVQQLKTTVFPAIFGGGNPPEDDMPLNDADIERIKHAVAEAPIGGTAIGGGKDVMLWTLLGAMSQKVLGQAKDRTDGKYADDLLGFVLQIDKHVYATSQQVDKLTAAVASLTAAVEQLRKP